MQALTPLTLPSLAVSAGATTPTARVGALVWSTIAGSMLQFNGSSWRPTDNPTVRLKMCSADYTPTAIGADLGGLITVPYLADGLTTAVAWNVLDIFLRTEVSGSVGATSVQIQRSTGTGAFTNVGALNTTAVSIAAGAYEPTTRPAAIAVATVNSGDKLMPYYTALGTGASGFTLWVLLQATTQ